MSAYPVIGRRLRWALGGTLLTTAVVASMPDDGAPAVDSAPVARPHTASAISPAASAASPGPITWPEGPRARGLAAWPAPAKSAVAAWGPPPLPAVTAAVAPRVAVVEVPAPTVEPDDPPPPYTLIGRIDDGGEPRALLLGAQRTLAVKRGDMVDGLWRVEAVQPEGVTLSSVRAGQRLILSFKPA